MLSSVPLTLARVFVKMHLRDRQAIVFSLFFPIAFMLALGITGGAGNDPIELGVVNSSDGEMAGRFVQALKEDPLFNVTEGGEEQLRADLIEGDSKIVLILPTRFEDLRRKGRQGARRIAHPGRHR